MAKVKNIYVCNQCGYESPKWIGKCPSCDSWNTMMEEVKIQRNPQCLIEQLL